MPGFYKDATGRVVGPVSTGDIKKMVRQGVVTKDTLLSRSQNGPWQRAADLGGLKDIFAATGEGPATYISLIPALSSASSDLIATKPTPSLGIDAVNGSPRTVSPKWRRWFSRRKGVALGALAACLCLAAYWLLGVRTKRFFDETLWPARQEAASRAGSASDSESAWNSESPSGIFVSSRQMDQAIESALGEESFAFDGDTYSGVRLGSTFEDVFGKTTPQHKLYVWNIPRKEPLGERYVRLPRVVFDAQSRRVVAVSELLPRLARVEVRDFLLKTFAKTPQSSVSFGDASVMRYTFSESVVRIWVLPNETTVWVFDREYLERNLRAYANAVVATCEWIQDVRDHCSLDKEEFEISGMPQLGDTKQQGHEKDACVLFVDSAAGRLANAEQSDSRIEREPLVAAVGTLQRGEVGLVAQPSLPIGVGLDRLLVEKESGAGASLIRSPVTDLFWNVANVLVQAYFPPDTETISIISEEAKFASWDSRLSPRRRFLGLWGASEGTRYEWRDTEGWLVRVTSSGRIMMGRPRAK